MRKETIPNPPLVKIARAKKTLPRPVIKIVREENPPRLKEQLRTPEPPLPISTWDIRLMIGYYVEINGECVAGPFPKYQDGHHQAINARRQIIYRQDKAALARAAWEAEQKAASKTNL